MGGMNGIWLLFSYSISLACGLNAEEFQSKLDLNLWGMWRGKCPLSLARFRSFSLALSTLLRLESSMSITRFCELQGMHCLSKGDKGAYY